MKLSKKNIIIISCLLAAFIAVGVIIYKKIKNKKPETNRKTGNSSEQNTSNDEFPLKLGSSGTKVLELQKALNKLNSVNPKLTEDGIFGNETKRALLQATNQRFDQVINQAALDQLINFNK
jgi:peptidoglycan hydrolase-like protein with peptidoglycan-binding domain